MICSLKDQLDTMSSVTELLRDHAMDIREVNWPEKKENAKPANFAFTCSQKATLKSRYI